jgi:hypothetical protein
MDFEAYFGRFFAQQASIGKRVGEREIVGHIETVDAQAGLAVFQVYLDHVRLQRLRPEDTAWKRVDVEVEVVDLVGVRRQGVNLTPVDVKSNEDECRLVAMVVNPDVFAFHETDVDVVEELLVLAVGVGPDPCPAEGGDPNGSVEIGD